MLERIAASLPSLAPAEQRVAQLVLDDPAAFARLPVRTLAELARVSKPTVVRFCRSMGYDGLADLKLKLVGSVSEGVPFVHRSVDVDDKAGDVLVKVVDNSVAAFWSTAMRLRPRRWRRPPRRFCKLGGSTSALCFLGRAIRAWWPMMRSTNSSAWG